MERTKSGEIPTSKRESISQVINLLRTNTQNIFHLENSQNSLENNHNLSTSATLTPTYNASNKKISNLKEKQGHKHSKSTTSAMDLKSAISLAQGMTSMGFFEWDRPTTTAPVNPDPFGLGGDDVWRGSRPRSYSESYHSPPILDADSPSSSASISPTPTKKTKGKRDKEKRGSKPLAPVMAFTTGPSNRKSLPPGEGGVLSVSADASCDETLVALNASRDKARKLKKKESHSLTNLPTLTPSPPGYFDKFMMDFYPELPTTSTTPNSSSSLSISASATVCLLYWKKNIYPNNKK